MPINEEDESHYMHFWTYLLFFFLMKPKLLTFYGDNKFILL